MTDDTNKVVPIRPTMAAALMGNPAGAAALAAEFDNDPGNPVEDIAGFMSHLAKWQKFHLARMRHMVKIPAGNSVEIIDDQTGQAKTLVLDGDVLEAFKLGLRMGISEFTELPFAAETEEAEPTQDQPASGDTTGGETSGD